MARPDILIIGRGFLGGQLRDFFGERALLIGRPDIEIVDLASVRAVLGELRPRVLINAAAATSTADLEKSEHQAAGFAVNVQGPAHLAMACRELGIRFAHISSGMMFDGLGPGGEGWREGDTPNPASYYAWTKALADWQLYPYLAQDRTLILRIHLPISGLSHPKNFLQKLPRFAQALTVESSMTVVEDFLVALQSLLGQEAGGIFNVVNPGQISAYRITELLKEEGLIDSDKEIAAMSRQQLDEQTALNGTARQAFPLLNTDKLRHSGIDLPPIEAAVRRSIRQLKISQP